MTGVDKCADWGGQCKKNQTKSDLVLKLKFVALERRQTLYHVLITRLVSQIRWERRTWEFEIMISFAYPQIDLFVVEVVEIGRLNHKIGQ